MSRILVLNGIGSVGKTSVARALQRMCRRPLLHVAMDGFLEMLPEALQDHPDGIHYLPGEKGVEVHVGPVGKRLLDGMLGAVEALAVAGNDLVFDTVMGRETHAETRRRLVRFDTAFIGLTAPFEVIEAREVARGDRMIGLARAQRDWVHVGPGDDLVLDTAAIPAETAARMICDRFGL